VVDNRLSKVILGPRCDGCGCAAMRRPAAWLGCDRKDGVHTVRSAVSRLRGDFRSAWSNFQVAWHNSHLCMCHERAVRKKGREDVREGEKTHQGGWFEQAQRENPNGRDDIYP
jgi:hypothetical protein